MARELHILTKDPLTDQPLERYKSGKHFTPVEAMYNLGLSFAQEKALRKEHNLQLVKLINEMGVSTCYAYPVAEYKRLKKIVKPQLAEEEEQEEQAKEAKLKAWEEERVKKAEERKLQKENKVSTKPQVVWRTKAKKEGSCHYCKAHIEAKSMYYWADWIVVDTPVKVCEKCCNEKQLSIANVQQ